MKSGLVVGLCSLAVVGCASSSPRYTQYQGQSTEAYGPPAAAPTSNQMNVAYIYLPGRTVAEPVHYQNVNGMAVTEGDILLGPADQVQARYAFPKFKNASHATSTDKSHLWPGATIPYAVDASVTPQKQQMVQWAVAHVSAESVVKLRPRTASDADYVLFTEQGGSYGCSSYVGRAGGAQDIQVNGCGSAGSVVHEIGHASGFYHEQQRTDRDQYITIVWDAISPGNEQWFKVHSNAHDIGAYDYGSIMHYGRTAFSESGADTIVPKDPNAKIGQREGLSMMDKAGLAQLYGGGGGLGGGGIEIPGVGVIPGIPGFPGFPGTTPGSNPPPGNGGNGGTNPPNTWQIPGLPPIQTPAGFPQMPANGTLPPLPQLPFPSAPPQ